MLILIDQRMLPAAKEKLSSFGELLEIKTVGQVYPAISGHPDIFVCQGPGTLIVAPNFPEHLLWKIKEQNIDVITGEFPAGNEYPATARYNAVVTDKYLIHNFRHTDFSITRAFDDHTPVHVDQGYCRCNLLWLKEDVFITSDEGIYKVLKRFTGNLLYVRPDEILLQGFPHGFFGGCCGVWDDKVFINGNLKYYQDGGLVAGFVKNLGYRIIELYDGPLLDVGGILLLTADC
jgi:hypothetical protein